MKKKRAIFQNMAMGLVIGTCFVLGISSLKATAQTSHKMSVQQPSQFRRIEQPLGNKVAVTLGGVAIIGLEIWWFLLSKPQSQKKDRHDSFTDED